MNVSKFLLLFILGYGLSYTTGSAYAQLGVDAAVPAMADTAVTSLVELLKIQALQRKEFFADQARQKREKKGQLKQEIENLKKKHRLERDSFRDQKKGREERSDFYQHLRKEMQDLQVRQKTDFRSFEKELRDRLKQFYESQKNQRKAIKQKK